MDWDHLSADRERQQRLPGFSDGMAGAVTRTFDAPEAMGINFHEIHARSILNQVPKQSRMRFRWTINPYRGCTHACSYCAGGDTPVLMADGRTKPLAEVQVGDAIYGTVRSGAYRRYAITRVLAHWSTVKPAFRITLEDGTELIASGDHRFLTDRGWKYVVGTEWGLERRPHLTTNNELMGVGGFAGAPADSADFRRGYLCGLIRGDGHVGSYSYERPGRTVDDHHRFRLALVDPDALHRAHEFLKGFGVTTDEFVFHPGADRVKRTMAIRTSARDKVAAVKELIRWPGSSCAEWEKGFLAGIYDAEGSYSRGIMRVSNTDAAIIQRTASSLDRLGFDYAIESTNRANGLTSVRVRGGLREHLRFLHSVDPAIARKRTINGTAIKSNARLRVVEVEPLEVDLPLFDITTGSGDFIANGVVSHNCFARVTHPYLGFDAGRDFEREIVVKVNAPELAMAEVSRPSWKRELVAMGTNTDPYQWAEGRYRLMPGILEALRDSRTPASILTKSSLVLRDIDLFRELAEAASISVSLSVPTLQEEAWRASEPHTPHPRKRLEAVAELNRAGIPSGVMIAPLMPGINDRPEQVARIVELADEAKATHVTPIALHLRGEVRDLFFDWLREHRPELVQRYEELFGRGAYMQSAERRRLGGLAHAARGA